MNNSVHWSIKLYYCVTNDDVKPGEHKNTAQLRTRVFRLTRELGNLFYKFYSTLIKRSKFQGNFCRRTIKTVRVEQKSVV